MFRSVDWSCPRLNSIPVVSSQDHNLSEMSVQMISLSGLLKPYPNPASRIIGGQFGFWAAGTGFSPVVQTPSRNPDRFSAVVAVAFTDCAEEDDARYALVRKLSARWLLPF